MTRTILLANGCSMCYGSELFDDPITKQCTDNLSRMKQTWPGRLGQNLNFSDVINLGYPSGSNNRILRTSIAWVIKNGFANKQQRDRLFVCIGWTHPMRREFYIDDRWRQLIPYHDYQDTPTSMLTRIYREVAWSNYEAAIRYATQLLSLQSFLKQYHIPFLFFDAITPFHLINQEENNTLIPYIGAIDATTYYNFNQLDDCMATYLGTATDKGNQKHPDKHAHQLWATKLKSFIVSNKLMPVMSSSHEVITYAGTKTVTIYDQKVGLAKKPPSNNFTDFTPIDLDDDAQKVRKKNILHKIFKAQKRDPFIYE